MNDSILEFPQNRSSLNESNFSTIFNSPKSDWGPKRDPLSIVIPISIIYVLIFITGVLGNVSTCIVIARNKCMHTATNYYLFSLAISDLLLLTSGLPPEIYSIWSKYPYIFGEEFCVLQGFAAEASANATVLIITAFTIERYVAICYPFLSHTLSNLSRAIKYIIYIWILAICLAIPQAVAFGIVCEHVDGYIIDEHCVCMPKRYIIPYAFEISTILFFITPMSLITILYVLIAVQLQKSLKPSRDNGVKIKHRVFKPVGLGSNNGVLTYERTILSGIGSNQEGRKICARKAYAAKHVVKMLVAVVIAFFICWAPFHTQRLFAIYATPTSSIMITAFQILTYVSGVFYYFSTTVNPLLYNIMSHKFRQAFKATYRQYCKRRQSLPGNRRYSSLSARSSQVNTHSTDSYTHCQNSVRYLEEKMIQLGGNRRPLVVSFRKNKNPNPNQNEIQDALEMLRSRNNITTSYNKQKMNAQFQVDSLQNVTKLNQFKVYSNKETHLLNLVRNNYGAGISDRFETNSADSNFFHGTYGDVVFKTNRKEMMNTIQNDNERINYLELNKNYNFMEVNNLQPTHICPLNRKMEFL